MRRRGCAGDGTRPATHGSANRGAGQAPDRNRYDTPDRCAKAGTGHAALYGASAGIRVPMAIPIIISTVIGRVRDPMNMLITLVSVVIIGVVVGDRRVCPVGITLMHAPAFAVRIAGDIGCSLGKLAMVGAIKVAPAIARKPSPSAVGNCLILIFHCGDSMGSRFDRLFRTVPNEARRRWFQPCPPYWPARPNAAEAFARWECEVLLCRLRRRWHRSQVVKQGTVMDHGLPHILG